MAGSRLGRKVAEAIATYRREPPELRAEFEAGLVAALEALAAANKLGPDTARMLKDVLGQIFVEGYVGGSWAKVHAALAEEAPAIYVRVKDRLPSATSSNPLAL
ncbi:MAG: hypothetical protein ACJ8GN_02055 [Longimicrobiaceae bacterium]